MTTEINPAIAIRLGAFNSKFDDPAQCRRAAFRLPILLNLILEANLRLQVRTNIVGLKEIIETDSLDDVTSALIWLFNHGALYAVSPRLSLNFAGEMMPLERVFQLTGVIRFRGEWVPYLVLRPNTIQNAAKEWASVGPETPVTADFFIPRSDPFSDESEE